MQKLLFIIIFLTCFAATAQKKCDCPTILQTVSTEIEKNSASFAHQVIEANNTKLYKKHKQQMLALAKSNNTEKQCLGIIQLYLSFLRDAHQQLYITNNYYPFASFGDTIAVKNFISKNVENYSVKEKTDTNELEGTWYHKRGVFAMQIQKHHQDGKEYIGVLKDEFKSGQQFLGYKGDLRAAFYKNFQNELVTTFYDFGQKPSVYKVKLEKDTLTLGRNMVFYRDKNSIKQATDFALPNATYFEELNSNTNYLRIHTFDYQNKKSIDSLLAIHKNKLSATENLIIDIRNNDGGSDYSYQSLLPFILDKNEFESAIVASSKWVSKDNWTNYYNERYQYNVSTKADSLAANAKMEKLKQFIGKFEPYTKVTSRLDSIYTFPKKIYVIQNKAVASSAEGFVLAAKQSKKVTIVGKNTGGYLSYGEWRKYEIPNFPAWISITQKKMILANDADFEMIGIAPDILLDSNHESKWIDQVKKMIEP